VYCHVVLQFMVFLFGFIRHKTFPKYQHPSSGITVEDHLPHYSKVEGSNPASVSSTGREYGKKVLPEACIRKIITATITAIINSVAYYNKTSSLQ
jgi:hypothetical protein